MGVLPSSSSCCRSSSRNVPQRRWARRNVYRSQAIFLLSCCVNSQLLAQRFSSKRETARSLGRWEKTLYLLGYPAGTSAEERATPLARFCMTDCPRFVFGRPVILSGNYRQKCWSGGINKVYYGKCENSKRKKKKRMNVPWEKYRAESIVNLINNPFVFFFSKLLESYTFSTNRRPSSCWGVEKRRFMWYYTKCIPSRFYKNCLASILHPDISFEADLKKKIPSPVFQMTGRLWLK